MKTKLIPMLVTAVLAASAVQARADDEGDRAHQRAEHPQAPAQRPKPATQQQARPHPQSAPQAQTQGQAQAQAAAQAHQRERSRVAAPAAQNDPQRVDRGTIPGDPNHPSAPRGNPYAGAQGAPAAAVSAPAPAAPRVGGNGAQGSGRGAAGPNWQADRGRAQVRNSNQQRNWHDSQGHDWRANRGWYDRYRVDHFRFDNGRYFARQRYSVGIYAYPRGYSTHLWLAGESLPSVFFFDGRYDLSNYWSYNLYEPPQGCRWTRVGNDALLVDEETGEVLDVVYDLFW